MPDLLRKKGGGTGPPFLPVALKALRTLQRWLLRVLSVCRGQGPHFSFLQVAPQCLAESGTRPTFNESVALEVDHLVWAARKPITEVIACHWSSAVLDEQQHHLGTF